MTYISPLLVTLLFITASVKSQVITETLPDINITEGYPAGRVLMNITHRFPGDLLVLTIGGDDLQFSVFLDHFSEMGRGVIVTDKVISRDDIANALEGQHLPVVFNIIYTVYSSTDNGQLQESHIFNVTLRIFDVDNNDPVFEQYRNRYLEVSITEGDPDRSVVIPTATDNDEGVNSTQSYTLSNNFQGLFRLEVRRDENDIINSVRLIQNVSLDREERSSYILEITATEGSPNPQSAVLSVNITVMDTCDVNPMFPVSTYYARILENSPIMHIVHQNITTTDEDLDDTKEYTITRVCGVPSEGSPCSNLSQVQPPPFSLDSESGVLTINNDIDREEYVEYMVNINVVDSCMRRDTATVVVTIEDINDNPPDVNIVAGSNIVRETLSVGQNIYSFNIEDRDNNSGFTINLYDNSTGVLRSTDAFQLDLNTLRLRLGQQLDREETSEYSLVINVTDWGSPNMSTTLPLPIIVGDANDNAPIFDPLSQPLYIYPENQLPNTVLVHLRATDRDTEESGNGAVTYRLPPRNSSFPHQDLFYVDQMGRLIVNGSLDRESQEYLSILVQAHDNPRDNDEQSMSDYVIVNLMLSDVNDNKPVILTPPETLSFSESQATGEILFTVTASDNDTEQFSNLTYSLGSQNTPFRIDAMTGNVFLDTPLDYETIPVYTLELRATDGELTGKRNVTISVEDVNDERCVFVDRPGHYMVNVLENLGEDYPILNINATDEDTPTNQLRFAIESGNERDHFIIQAEMGELRTTVSLDKERVGNYTLRISCSDGSGFNTETSVFVQVVDINDHFPQFINTPYNFSVREELPVNERVNRIQAVDADSRSNNIITYRLLQAIPAATESWFNVDGISGQITTTTVIDREAPELEGVQNSVIILSIAAYDHYPGNGSGLHNTTLAHIQILDINDQPPVFLRPNITIELPEDFPVGRTLPVSIQAIDKDVAPNNDTYYRITGTSSLRFQINRDSGALKLRMPLDFETSPVHYIEVHAIDETVMNFQATQLVIISVQDVQEVNVQFENFLTDVDLPENSLLNQTVSQFRVVDLNGRPLLGQVPTLRYTIEDEDGMVPLEFGIRNNTAESKLIVYVDGPIDRELLSAGSTGVVERVLNITVRDIDISEQSHGSKSGTLTVTIMDINDNPPTFVSSSYTFNVSETIPGTNSIGSVRATDPDLGLNGNSGITYHIPSPNRVPFRVNRNGVITTNGTLDYEMVRSYDFTIVAMDGGPEPMSSSVSVHVDVMDENDNPPMISQAQNRTFLVGEETDINTEVAFIQSSDDDSGIFGQVSLSLGVGAELLPSRYFRLEPNGSLVLIHSLDREDIHSFNFTVVASDGGGKTTTADIRIIVQDYNDNPPVFNSVVGNIMVPEDQRQGAVFTKVTADDADIGNNGDVHYEIGNYSLRKTFCIDRDGNISLCLQHPSCLPNNVIDFERRSEYDVNIVAYDLGLPRHIVSKNIRIVVSPVNEYPPLFDRGFFKVYVNETQNTGVEVARIRAIDRDKNDQITYEVLDENSTRSQVFRYNTDSGAIVNNNILDYNVKKVYILELLAKDSGNKNGTARVMVIVNNINDHTPVFDAESTPEASNQPFLISEGTRVSTVIWTVRATDLDNATHDALTYYLEHDSEIQNFNIDPLTGEITVSSPLDYELKNMYTLRVYARDSGSPSLLSTPIVIRIAIKNENDEYPVFNSTQYRFTVPEKEPIGTVVGRVHARDRDIGSFGDIQYSFVDGPHEYFEIHPLNGDISTLTVIDRDAIAENERRSVVEFNLNVLASDNPTGSNVKTSVVNLNIRVLDLNDNAPEFNEIQYLVKIAPNQETSVSLTTTVSVHDPDEGSNSQYRYELPIPDGNVPLVISSTGQLSLPRSIPTNHRPSYSYILRVIDALDSSLFNSVKLELIIESENDHHPRFNPVVSSILVNELTINSVVFRVEDVVSDTDSGPNGQLSYRFAVGESYPEFSIDSTNGAITVQRRLDFENVNARMHTLIVEAMDNTPGIRRTATGKVIVTVEAGNEYAPLFENVPSYLTLSHLRIRGLEVFKVVARDQDEGRDGEVMYNMFNSERYFTIDQMTGIMRTQGVLDTDTTVNVTIGAYDLGIPNRSSNTTILITIHNPGNTVPHFVGENPLTITQLEDSPMNKILTTNPSADSYHIVSQTVSGQTAQINTFSITNNVLNNIEPLDYEQITMYDIVIESRIETRSSGSIHRSSDYLQVRLMVRNANDNSPVLSAIAPQTVSEATEVGTFLFRVHATDRDSGPEGNVSYYIIQGDSESNFRINTSSGQVFLAQSLDREHVSAYDLVIRAEDHSNQPMSSQITVHINVTDVNDSPTTYGGRNFSLGVYEFPSTRGGDKIIKLAATDEDEGPQLRYSLDIVEASLQDMTMDVTNLQGTFSIDPDTGLITVGTQVSLDRENLDYYLLRITARVSPTGSFNISETYLTIEILDVNDRPPVFQDRRQAETRVREGVPIGSYVMDVSASDPDIGINSWIKYSLGDDWPGNMFRIDPLSGVIRTNDVIVFNSSFINGEVIAEDQGVNQNRATIRIPITIIDVNNHVPMFESNSILLNISVGDMPMKVIHQFVVTDEDSSLNAEPFMFTLPHYYSEANNNFVLGAGSGELSLRQTQHESRSYNFPIHVSNPSHYPLCAEYAQASSINVTVVVRPENTMCPQFSSPIYSAELAEGMLNPMNPVSITEIMASDPDGDMVSYSIINSTGRPSLAQPFNINSESATLSLGVPLDREMISSYSFFVLATDDGFPPRSCSAEVSITVLDINDNRPIIERNLYTGYIQETSPANSPILARENEILRVNATDADVGINGTVIYELTHDSFWINRTSGEIFTKRVLDYETRTSYEITAIARDMGIPPASSTVRVSLTVMDVNEHRPVITNPTPVDPVNINKNTSIGSIIYTVMVNDSDRGAQLFYSFKNPEVASCYFELNSSTGAIKLIWTSNTERSPCGNEIMVVQEAGSQYFILPVTVVVSDGDYQDTIDLKFRLYDSTVATTQTPSVFIISACVTGVLLAVIAIVCVLILVCFFRSRKHSKIRINDTAQSIELRKRFGSGRSNNKIPGPVYKQTSVGILPPEHTTMNISHAGGSGASSTRQSFVCGEVENEYQERISYPSPSGVSRKSQLSKPYRSTSDLGSSTMATEVLSTNSQDIAPYPKSQIERIYAKNADLLNTSDSNESIHMFGSEGGGESDGGDDMLFAKFNDLDDDDDSTTMQDEDDRSYQARSMTSSRENLNIPSVDIIEEAYPFDHTAGLNWAPRVNNMADTIDQMTIDNYDDKEPMRRGQLYMEEFNKSQGGSMYGASTQESTRPLLRHTHHPGPQSRFPLPQHVLQPPPDYYNYNSMGEDVRLHEHMIPRVPTYGPPSASGYSHPREHHPMVRHAGEHSQEAPGLGPYSYCGDYIHRDMGVDHSPSSSTPTEETLTTRALTNEYESDIMYSSDTSINTNTDPLPPHRVIGFSQSGHGQRHGYH